MISHFVEKYTKGMVDIEVGKVTDRSAILRLKFTEKAHVQSGPYRQRCAELACESVKGVLASIPERVHRLPPATVTDIGCMVNGDAWCEWEVTWSPQTQRGFVWTAWERLTGKAPPSLDVCYEEFGEALLKDEQRTVEQKPTELLSKDHTILEKRFMEYRPFGVDEQGNKINDVSGVNVQSDVECLEEYVSRTAVPEAGAQAVEELCRLLNERIRDPVYHVTPGFLKNAWNSYSYEFVCFLREFSETLSGDPCFHFNEGKSKKVPPIIQILGRPFSVQQIFKMWPHFAQKYEKGCLECSVGKVTDRSAVLRMKFTEKAYRQFGPYRRRCAWMVCQSTSAAWASVPEQVHHLSPATVIH
ncbi:MAG: hypothetical protein ICV76_06820, partial [Nitrospiraceae bacterium]|nr:hypothetical protein [Nitrospiraceae bacterium]